MADYRTRSARAVIAGMNGSMSDACRLPRVRSLSITSSQSDNDIYVGPRLNNVFVHFKGIGWKSDWRPL